MKAEDLSAIAAVAFAIPWFAVWISTICRARRKLFEVLELLADVWQPERNTRGGRNG